VNDTWDYASGRWLQRRQDAKWYKKDVGYVERLNDHLAGVRLADITTPMVAAIREKLARERASGTVNRIMGVLQTILRTAKDEWGILDSVPSVKRAKENERVRFLTKDEAAQLLLALPQHLKPIVQFALATGLRQANILNLEWSEVSLTRRSVAIPGSKMKNGLPFGAPLNPTAVSILAAQKGKHPRWVFPVMRSGEYGPLSGIHSATWAAACAKAGIEDFNFHDLRHTWASWHLQNGTNLIALQELGGWKDDAMVKRYAHLAKHHLTLAAANIEDQCQQPISPAKTSRRNSKSARSKPGE
jgi:integrase